MRLLILSFLALFLGFVSTLRSPYSSKQQHVVLPIKHPIQSTTDSTIPLSAHCIDGYYFKCHYNLFYKPGQVLCRCKRYIWDGEGCKKESASSLYITAEVQPGKNETRVNLFKLDCEEGSFVGCVSGGVGGFICGCHEDVCSDYEDESEGCADDSEARRVGGSGGDDPNLKELQVEKSGGFQFQKVRFPRCTKVGYHLQCREVEGKSRCFCGR